MKTSVIVLSRAGPKAVWSLARWCNKFGPSHRSSELTQNGGVKRLSGPLEHCSGTYWRSSPIPGSATAVFRLAMVFCYSVRALH